VGRTVEPWKPHEAGVTTSSMVDYVVHAPHDQEQKVERKIQSNAGALKMQDWKMTDESAGLENAGLENDGRKCSAGK